MIDLVFSSKIDVRFAYYVIDVGGGVCVNKSVYNLCGSQLPPSHFSYLDRNQVSLLGLFCNYTELQL